MVPPWNRFFLSFAINLPLQRKTHIDIAEMWQSTHWFVWINNVTKGGYVYSMDASSRANNPTTFTNLAIGIGDGSIRVWKHRVNSGGRDPYEGEKLHSNPHPHIGVLSWSMVSFLLLLLLITGAFLWKGLQGKVSCVRYHPQPPSSMSGVECLAFGTEVQHRVMPILIQYVNTKCDENRTAK